MLARTDFIAAVALTVVAPRVLTAQLFAPGYRRYPTATAPPLTGAEPRIA